MRKNNKGITIIALIVTIIVLIVIATVSIATLTSDNGVLRQTNSAKVSQIEGNAREQVDLACSSVVLSVLEAQIKGNEYSISQKQELLVNTLNQNKQSLTGSFISGGIVSEEKVAVLYEGEDYKSATNNPSAKIKYIIDLKANAFKVTAEENSTIKDGYGNDIEMDIGANSGTGAGTGSGTGISGAYLVDEAKIGDYVNIGIEYTNNLGYSYGHESDELANAGNELIGWRVLGKSGEGANGTVTLVSAGTPLTYYHASGDKEKSNELLSDLREIEIITSESGFRTNGFTGVTKDSNNKVKIDNLLNANSKIIDISAGVHALTVDEAKNTYYEITGLTIDSTTNPIKLNSTAFKTNKMSTVEGTKWNDNNARHLLEIGMSYFLKDSDSKNGGMWIVFGDASLFYGSNYEIGVRPVITLKAGVQIDNINPGDGLSNVTAYNLKK